MKRNKIIIILIVIVSIIILTTTINSSNTNNDIITTLNNEINNLESQFTDDDYEPQDKYEITTINVRNYEELKNAIIENSKTWKNRSVIINLEDGDYNITGNFRCGDPHTDSQYTINGNGHIIDGQNKYQFMELYANLKIKDLTIQNTVPGESNSSSAITMESVSNLYLKNCKFINNTGNTKGSAITNRGTAYITDCQFINNTVENIGGAIWSTGEYGGTLTVDNCIFETNKANNKDNHERTAIIYMVSYGNNTINNSQFIRNNGRCIHSYNYTSTNITNNKFTGNKLSDNEIIRGGIIDNYESDITIKNNEFNDDVTEGELRGGILYHEVGKLEFSNNKISNNNIKSEPSSISSCSKGGVIFNRNATAIIENNTFENFIVGNYTRGGVLYNNLGEIHLKNNIFNNTLEGEHVQGLIVFNDVNSILNVENNTLNSKNKGSIEFKNEEDKYIFNSNVPNEEGSGIIGITNYN